MLYNMANNNSISSGLILLTPTINSAELHYNSICIPDSLVAMNSLSLLHVRELLLLLLITIFKHSTISQYI